MADKKLVVRIDPELLEAVKAKAKAKDLTVSQVVRHYLRRWVAEDPPDEPYQGGEAK